MRLELTARHLDITPALRRLVETKLAKLERVLNDSAMSAQAVLTREKYRHKAEITLHARGEKFLHGVGSSTSWETSIGQAIDKLHQQAQKLKGKWQERKRRAPKGAPPAINEREAIAVKPAPAPRRPAKPRMPRVLRAERQPIKSMSVADAAREVDANEGRVIVFRDAETTEISVLYRGKNGELNLVETES
jgi:putative sigma-54 modulation protein